MLDFLAPPSCCSSISIQTALSAPHRSHRIATEIQATACRCPDNLFLISMVTANAFVLFSQPVSQSFKPPPAASPLLSPSSFDFQTNISFLSPGEADTNLCDFLQFLSSFLSSVILWSSLPIPASGSPPSFSRSSHLPPLCWLWSLCWSDQACLVFSCF